ncbi:MAG: hypothetical protein KatS3mg014_1453 [Actinomycetota bacterium]|nr:MAG: hypothetical protein KatS3mg014_1453 [Actinomycetota bacterium]
MRRTQIYLDEDIDREIRALAAAQGRSAASVIREAIRRFLAEQGVAAGRLTAIRGLGKEAWAGVDPESYVEDLRREWTA